MSASQLLPNRLRSWKTDWSATLQPKETGRQSSDAGRAFIEHARLCLFHGKRAMEAVQTAARETGSVLSIGRSPYIDPVLISTLLTVRLPLFPDLKLKLPSRFSLDLIHDVLASTLDLAIVTDPPESLTLSTVQIAEAPFHYYGRRGRLGSSTALEARRPKRA
jgi:DNA-binding transcriptional LysR family regulator